MSPFVVMIAVLALLAGGLPALLASPSGSGQHPGLAVQAPGSDGSVHSVPWWDPRGWFGGGGGVPAVHVIAGFRPAAGRPAGHVAGQGPHKPAHRVRELTAERTEYGSTYEMSDGTRQQVISGGPVNYQTSSGRWAPVSTVVVKSSRAGYAFQNVTNAYQSFFGSSAGRLIRFGAPGGGWVAVGLRGGRAGGPRVNGDTVTYPSVAPGVSLSYTVTPRSLVERISLASPAAAKSLADAAGAVHD